MKYISLRAPLGIHAREWIAPAVAAYVIQQLSESKEAHKYIDKFNFYLLPVANPDGYEYTRQSVRKLICWVLGFELIRMLFLQEDNRMWRKNRRKNEGSKCYGVDLNRNFDFKFGGTE